MLWLIEHWPLILSTVSFLLSVPIYLVVRKIVRISRMALALEICREDLRLTTDRVKRLSAHIEAAGIDSSQESAETPST